MGISSISCIVLHVLVMHGLSRVVGHWSCAFECLLPRAARATGDAFVHGLPSAYGHAADLGGLGPVGPGEVVGLAVALGVLGFAALEGAVHAFSRGGSHRRCV